MRIAFVRPGSTVDVVIFEDSLDILFQCDRSLVAAAITHDEHRRPRPARAGMFLIDDPRRLEREVARLEPARSEEHTSELQSLMRISYAVFCLKKKKKK